MIKSGIGVFVVDKYDEISVPLIHEKTRYNRLLLLTENVFVYIIFSNSKEQFHAKTKEKGIYLSPVVVRFNLPGFDSFIL